MYTSDEKKKKKPWYLITADDLWGKDEEEPKDKEEPKPSTLEEFDAHLKAAGTENVLESQNPLQSKEKKRKPWYLITADDLWSEDKEEPKPSTLEEFDAHLKAKEEPKPFTLEEFDTRLKDEGTEKKKKKPWYLITADDLWSKDEEEPKPFTLEEFDARLKAEGAENVFNTLDLEELDEGPYSGCMEEGNISRVDIPFVRNADGSVSTVRSKSFNMEGVEVLLPTIAADGHTMNDEETVNQYLTTGMHLGKFQTPEQADRYGKFLSKQESERYSQWLKERPISELPQLRATPEELIPGASQRGPNGEPTIGYSIGQYILAGVWQTTTALWKATEILYGLGAELTDYIADPSTPEGKTPKQNAIRQWLTDQVEEGQQLQSFAEGQAASKSWIRNTLLGGFRAVPLIAASALTGAAIAPALSVTSVGMLATKIFGPEYLKMLGFITLTGALHAEEIEEEREKIGKETPYWMQAIAAVIGGHEEAATELPVFVGGSKLFKLIGADKAIEAGAKTFFQRYGPHAVEILKNIDLQGLQEAEMVPLERALKQMFGLPQDWSLKAVAGDALNDYLGGISMGLIMFGLGGGSYEAHTTAENAIKRIETDLGVLVKEGAEEGTPTGAEKGTPTGAPEGFEMPTIVKPGDYAVKVKEVVDGLTSPAGLLVYRHEDMSDYIPSIDEFFTSDKFLKMQVWGACTSYVVSRDNAADERGRVQEVILHARNPLVITKGTKDLPFQPVWGQTDTPENRKNVENQIEIREHLRKLGYDIVVIQSEENAPLVVLDLTKPAPEWTDRPPHIPAEPVAPPETAYEGAPALYEKATTEGVTLYRAEDMIDANSSDVNYSGTGRLYFSSEESIVLYNPERKVEESVVTFSHPLILTQYEAAEYLQKYFPYHTTMAQRKAAADALSLDMQTLGYDALMAVDENGDYTVVDYRPFWETMKNDLEARSNLHDVFERLSSPDRPEVFTLGELEANIQAGPEPATSHIPNRGWDLVLDKEKSTEEVTNTTKIRHVIEHDLEVPIRAGTKAQLGPAIGAHWPYKNIIRMRNWGDLGPLSHEAAHRIDTIISKDLPAWKSPNQFINNQLASFDYDKSAFRPNEGFAELFMWHLTGQRKGQLSVGETRAPEFFEYFWGTVLPKFPKLEKTIRKLAHEYDVWNRMGAQQRIYQMQDIAGSHTKVGTLSERINKAAKRMYTLFVDSFFPVQEFVSKWEATTGITLYASKNPAVLAQVYKMSAGSIAYNYVFEGTIDYRGRKVGPSLVEILKPLSEKEIPEFFTYMMAKRAALYMDKGLEHGFLDEDVKYVLDKYSTRNWDSIAARFTAWADSVLDWLTFGGGLSPEEANAIKLLNPVYIYFKRITERPGITFRKQSGFVNVGPGLYRRRGGSAPVYNVLEATVSQLTELIGRAQQLKIASAIGEMYDKYPGALGIGGLIEELRPADIPKNAIRFNIKQLKHEFLDIAKGEGVDASAWDFDRLATIFVQGRQYRGTQAVVSLYIGGKQRWYELHPEFYDALMHMNPPALSAVWRIMHMFTSLVRLGATSLNFAFAMYFNPARDAFTGAVASKRMDATIFDTFYGVYKSITAKPGDIAWRMKVFGLEKAGFIGRDRATTMRAMDELVLHSKGFEGKVLMVAKHPIDALREVFGLFELGPRIAEGDKMYRKYQSAEWQAAHPGWNELDSFYQALLDAKDVTVDFTRQGVVSRQINDVTAFFNAGVQGFDKIYRSFRDRPVQTLCKGVIWLTTFAVLMWLKNRDKEWYKNLDPAYKYNNVFVQIGNTIIRVPIPFGFGAIFMSAVTAGLDTSLGEKGGLEGMLAALESQFPSLIPNMFKPLIDVARNTTWSGLPIESEGMQRKYWTERHGPYTTLLSKELSKGLDKVGIHVSPVVLDYLLDSYTGGFFRQFRKGEGSPFGLKVLGNFIVSRPWFPRRQINDFFSRRNNLMLRHNAKIATPEEEAEYQMVKHVYTKYKKLLDYMTQSLDEGDKTSAERYGRDIKELLKDAGFE